MGSAFHQPCPRYSGTLTPTVPIWCGRVVRWCWVNFQFRGVLLISITVGQGPTALSVGAGGGCLDILSLFCHFSFLSPSLWETARYKLKYCLKGPLSPKQPTNHCPYGYKTMEKLYLMLPCVCQPLPRGLYT